MKATAWIIAMTDTLSVAVGEFELVHILPDNPMLFNIPKAPPYCQQIFVWQNKIIPVMNLAKRFGLENNPASDESFVVNIFAYRAEKTRLPEYGTLFSKAAPRRIEVSNEQACSLPAHLSSWTPYFRSCFQETETKKVIPILNLERLFAYQAVNSFI